MLTNALRAHLAELGLVAAQGPEGLNQLKVQFGGARDTLPNHAVAALSALITQAEGLAEEVDRLERRILDWHRTSDASRRLATIPGIGPITAKAIRARRGSCS